MDAADYWDMIGELRRALSLPCDRWPGCERGYAHDGACRRRVSVPGQMTGLERAKRGLAAVERAAYTAGCEYCGAALRHRGFSAPRGQTVTLTTCPRCDRYDERMDD